MTDKTTPERQPVADALPPLPASQAFSLTRSVYTADQMRAYASAALASRDAEIARVHAAYCHSQQQFLDAQAEITKIRQGEAVALPNCTVADVGFRWDGDKQEHIPQVLVSFTPVPANRPNDDKGWKDRDAFAGMLASPPPAQAAQAEPVAEAVMDLCQDHQGPVEALAFIPAGTKLYAAQPPREPVQPLSDEDMTNCGLLSELRLEEERRAEWHAEMRRDAFGDKT